MTSWLACWLGWLAWLVGLGWRWVVGSFGFDEYYHKPPPPPPDLRSSSSLAAVEHDPVSFLDKVDRLDPPEQSSDKTCQFSSCLRGMPLMMRSGHNVWCRPSRVSPCPRALSAQRLVGSTAEFGWSCIRLWVRCTLFFVILHLRLSFMLLNAASPTLFGGTLILGVAFLFCCSAPRGQWATCRDVPCFVTIPVRPRESPPHHRPTQNGRKVPSHKKALKCE